MFQDELDKNNTSHDFNVSSLCQQINDQENEKENQELSQQPSGSQQSGSQQVYSSQPSSSSLCDIESDGSSVAGVRKRPKKSTFLSAGFESARDSDDSDVVLLRKKKTKAKKTIAPIVVEPAMASTPKPGKEVNVNASFAFLNC